MPIPANLTSRDIQETYAVSEPMWFDAYLTEEALHDEQAVANVSVEIHEDEGKWSSRG